VEEMIGYCGYSCHLRAARSDDAVVRQKLVDGWRRIFGHQQYTVENVRCDGCRPGDARVSEEDYDLCMRQFDSMPHLVRLLAAAGRLDSWVVAEAGADSTGAGRASARRAPIATREGVGPLSSGGTP
jgi:hypothetical protein